MVVLIRYFFVFFVFVHGSCVKDSFIEVSPKPTVFGTWIGDSVYYYNNVNDSLFLKDVFAYSVFSPPDTFVFYQNQEYKHVFYSIDKAGGVFVTDSGDFNVYNDSVFLNPNTILEVSFSIDSLGFEKLVLLKKTLNKDSLIKYTYKKNIPMVSYYKEIFPIWENMCSNCHYKNSKYVSLVPLLEGYDNLINGVSVNGDYVGFANYIDTLNPLNSLLYLKIEGTAPGSIMPQPPYSPLPDYQKNIILKWIKQGALFN